MTFITAAQRLVVLLARGCALPHVDFGFIGTGPCGSPQVFEVPDKAISIGQPEIVSNFNLSTASSIRRLPDSKRGHRLVRVAITHLKLLLPSTTPVLVGY